MSATPWPMPDPPDRERFAELSDARLSVTPLPPAAPVRAVPAAGQLMVIDDRGVFVRGPHHPPRGDDRSASTGLTSAGPEQIARPVERDRQIDDRPVAVYVHGLAGNSTNFDSVGSVLATYARGHAIDLPGFGRSDPPPGERYSLDDDAEIVAEVIRRLSPRRPVHLVGNSLGGMVCILVASRHPELITSLTLISPAVPDLRLTTDRGADPRLGLLLAPGTTGLAVRRLGGIDAQQRAQGMAALCYGDPSSLTAEDVAAAAVELRWRFPLRWVHTSTIESMRALMRSYLRVGRRSFRSITASVTVPTLVIWGTKDRLVDCSLATSTAAAFAQSRLLVLAGCGHVAQMERPDATARAVLALWEDVDTVAADTGEPRSTRVPNVAPSTA
ncbi:alpha/beta hydrolase [Nakamurella sp. A5-74]|uniref:Alpha/beta hydrolase n=1 Tax=Nakamurella sp. A5-74 TaxID=3158264 RepID=A0AAU8DK34_9ACTN